MAKNKNKIIAIKKSTIIGFVIVCTMVYSSFVFLEPIFHDNTREAIGASIGDVSNAQVVLSDNYEVSNNSAFNISFTGNGNINSFAFDLNSFNGIQSVEILNVDKCNTANIKCEIKKIDSVWKVYIANFSGTSLINKNGDTFLTIRVGVGSVNQLTSMKLTNIHLNDKIFNEINLNLKLISTPVNPPVNPPVSTSSTSGGGSRSGGAYEGFGPNQLYPEKLSANIMATNLNNKCDDKEILIDIIGHWSEKDILWLKERCIVSGFGDDPINKNFLPDVNIYRGESVKMIVKAYDMKSKENIDYIFSDVDSLSKYASYIYTANANNIVEGYTDGTFRPYEYLTRSQALKILLKSKGFDRYDDYIEDYKIFSDVGMGFWDTKYISAGVGLGIIKGYEDGTFKPNQLITRAEFATMLMKTLNMN